MRGAIIPLPNTPPWRGSHLKIRTGTAYNELQNVFKSIPTTSICSLFSEVLLGFHI